MTVASTAVSAVKSVPQWNFVPSGRFVPVRVSVAVPPAEVSGEGSVVSRKSVTVGVGSAPPFRIVTLTCPLCVMVSV